MSNTHQDRNHKLYTDFIKQMMIDYVMNDMSPKGLADKYRLTLSAVVTIIDKHKFKEKRLSYQEKVLQKSVDKLATRHAFILSRISNILWKQVERLEKNQKDRPDELLDSNRMKEVLTAFALLSKEHRLDTDKPTDNTIHKVTVEFGSSVPIVSDNHLHNPIEDTSVVDAESTPVITPEEVKAVKEEGAEIDDDEPIFGSLD